MTEPHAAAEARASFRRVDALVDAALDRDSAERPAFVDAATAGEPAVRAAVHALLAAMRQADAAGDFLAAPVAPDPLQARLQHALGGAYRLRGRIGAGGMARVYLADDLRHGRPVAIKVMATDDAPPDTAPDPVAAARFLDEIGVMARLQHPHLLPLFDSGTADGVPYLVMPYVAGETLRARLTREGPLAVAEAVRLARAIAGALDHAHAAGVVHRDLKPENILLRDGEPLVADFGIALAAAGDARRTQAGALVGTPQYMAPEQAAGDGPVDARADCYALGAVLYEMLTGDPPHVAGTVQGVLARVRAARPTPARLLRAAVPVPLSDAIDRALATNPADRFPSAAAFGAALAAALAAPPDLPRRRRPRLAVGAAAIAGVSAIVLAGVLVARAGTPHDASTTAESARFVVAPLPEAAIGRAPTLTPDGASLVYAGAAESGRQLFVRPVHALAAHALPQTAGALNAVVSPDGRSVAYVTTDDQLMRIALDGGAPTVLGGVFRYSDVAWVGNDRLVVDSYGQGGLSWIPAAGGAVHLLTRLATGPGTTGSGTTGPGESGHGSPFALPDGRTVVFMISHEVTGPGTSPGELAVVSLDPARTGAGVHVPLGVRARRAVGWVDGWLLYLSVDGAHILAQRLDLGTGHVGTAGASPRLRGPAVSVLEHPDGGIDVATLARDGTLLYTRANTVNAPVLVDTAGRATPALGPRTGYFMNPRLSPDGRRLSAQVADAGGNDAWVYELATGTAMRLTRIGGSLGPSWTPDGATIVYYSALGGRDAIWRVAADGRSAPERIAEVPGAFAPSVSPDGREVLFQRTLGGLWGIWRVPLAPGPDGARPPQPVVVGRASACMPALSPDGRWLAYAANGSGRYEVYVRPYPGPGADVQVSRDGGAEPAWAPDGRRLFFRGDRRLYVGEVSTTGPALTVRDPRVLFVDAFDGDMPMPHRNYDVARDGRHFLMIGATPGGAPETVVVLRWTDELRARLARADGS